MSEELIADFRRLSCDADFWSLRLTDERAESYAIRKNVAQPPFLLADRGAMLTPHAAGAGGDVLQRYRFVMPGMSVTAHADGDTQTRTLNGYRGLAQQGGEDMLDRFGFVGSGRRLADEALQLLLAPNCPAGTMDVLLLPDQMVLQIHESIGHPLELDRILGDERNFAGTSFVTLDMFDSYQYGSDILNVTFDPTIEEEFSSYGYDDEGSKAQKEYLIKNGLL